MRYLLLILFLAGCENNVGVGQMEACKNTCAPRTVKRVSATVCECFPAEVGK